MNRIVTLTISPAIDVHVYGKEEKRYAGGKGLNVSCALKSFGISSKSILFLGEENEDEYLSLLETKENIETVTLLGRTRENYTYHTDKKEINVSKEGREITKSLLEKIKERLSYLEGGDYLAVSGTFLRNGDTGLFCDYLKTLRENKIKTVIDSRAFTLSDIIYMHPWLIKPNEEELKAYMSRDEDVQSFLKKLNVLGIENAAATLGERGAYLSNNSDVEFMPSFNIDVKSTVGSGDSFIAGAIASEVDVKLKKYGMLKTATAFAAAACLTDGTKPPKREDILSFLA